MFNNPIKKVAAIGFMFSLCVPCCLASAQQSEKPTVFTFKTSDLIQEIHNATLPSAGMPATQNLLTKIKEKQIEEFAAVQTMEDLCNLIIEDSNNVPYEAYNLLVTLAQQLGIPEDEVFDNMSPVLREVFNMDGIEYGAFVFNLMGLYGIPEEKRPGIVRQCMEEAYPNFW